MITDLLEPHQKRQHQAFALYPRRVRELLRQFPYRLFVEGGLLAAELAECFDFGFVRQICDDRLIGLQSAQNVRPYEFTQRAVGTMGPLRKAFGEARELLRRSQQARIDE